MSHTPQLSLSEPQIPCVVQVGFAGSRKLFDDVIHPQVNAEAFHQSCVDWLADRLLRLPEEMNLTKEHFLCGTSQMAIGADMVFTGACAKAGMKQRIFLPQHREDFLQAVGSKGVGDFSEQEKSMARELLDLPHIIQERVVSDSADRAERFEEVNLEIVSVSDVLVCLVRKDATARPGGTQHLMERALKRRKPVLSVMVSVVDGQAHLEETWHGLSSSSSFAPELPTMLRPAEKNINSAADYLEHVKKITGKLSGKHKRYFKSAAFLIIGAHILATICAVVAGLFYHDLAKGLLKSIYGLEMIFVLFGLFIHFHLHHSLAVQNWALARLISESARSAKALLSLRLYPDYFFRLPLPQALRPLMRTMNVMLLAHTRNSAHHDWQAARDSYIKTRIASPASGQIAFYDQAAHRAEKWATIAHRVFWTCSTITVVATLMELLHCFDCDFLHLDGRFLSLLAILMPVVAVGALSLSAAFDLAARHHTFSDMSHFLTKQQENLRNAVTEREFIKLVHETETRLLGETANWYSRRSFTGVT